MIYVFTHLIIVVVVAVEKVVEKVGDGDGGGGGGQKKPDVEVSFLSTWKFSFPFNQINVKLNQPPVSSNLHQFSNICPIVLHHQPILTCTDDS